MKKRIKAKRGLARKETHKTFLNPITHKKAVVTIKQYKKAGGNKLKLAEEILTRRFHSLNKSMKEELSLDRGYIQKLFKEHDIESLSNLNNIIDEMHEKMFTEHNKYMLDIIEKAIKEHGFKFDPTKDDFYESFQEAEAILEESETNAFSMYNTDTDSVADILFGDILSGDDIFVW